MVLGSSELLTAHSLRDLPDSTVSHTSHDSLSSGLNAISAIIHYVYLFTNPHYISFYLNDVLIVRVMFPVGTFEVPSYIYQSNYPGDDDLIVYVRIILTLQLICLQTLAIINQ